MSYRDADNSFLNGTVPVQGLSAHQETATSTRNYVSTMQASQNYITNNMPQECKNSSDPRPFPMPTVVDPWITKTLVQDVFKDNIDPPRQAVETARSQHIRQMKIGVHFMPRTSCYLRVACSNGFHLRLAVGNSSTTLYACFTSSWIKLLSIFLHTRHKFVRNHFMSISLP